MERRLEQLERAAGQIGGGITSRFSCISYWKLSILDFTLLQFKLCRFQGLESIEHVNLYLERRLERLERASGRIGEGITRIGCQLHLRL